MENYDLFSFIELHHFCNRYGCYMYPFRKTPPHHGPRVHPGHSFVVVVGEATVELPSALGALGFVGGLVLLGHEQRADAVAVGFGGRRPGDDSEGERHGDQLPEGDHGAERAGHLQGRQFATCKYHSPCIFSNNDPNGRCTRRRRKCGSESSARLREYTTTV